MSDTKQDKKFWGDACEDDNEDDNEYDNDNNNTKDNVTTDVGLDEDGFVVPVKRKAILKERKEQREKEFRAYKKQTNIYIFSDVWTYKELNFIGVEHCVEDMLKLVNKKIKNREIKWWHGYDPKQKIIYDCKEKDTIKATDEYIKRVTVCLNKIDD
jgi:hypothetical protein